ncbi:MAG: alpha/beta fold hydrolase [Methanoregulaceae archaeon]|nr:alpha/beta fold hydrolase [Methanoregulaceae archaeon]
MSGRYPVILVHGWNSHPGVWKRLVARLDEESIPYRRFDHTGMRDKGLPDISRVLGEYLQRIQRECGWPGPVDIVCHSMGTCIARYLLEVIDGKARTYAVRQLIGLGPPNNGSALAELFNDPERGEAIINRLTGVFVPEGFDPSSDLMVQDVRPGSPVIRSLRTAGLRSDITYRVIVTTNPDDVPEFFPFFQGKTWEIAGDGRYRKTLSGDGVVAHGESVLPGISLDVLSASFDNELNLPTPNQYCHIHLPKNPKVINRIIQYLTSPAGER